MPFTILKLPRLRKEKAMTYEEQAEAWIRSSPFVEITIGRFTLKFKFIADQDWGWDWDLTAPDNFEDTPEDKYYEEICHDLRLWRHDTEFVDQLIEGMKKKPFNQGETK
jgi:hypothetical protein